MNSSSTASASRARPAPPARRPLPSPRLPSRPAAGSNSRSAAAGALGAARGGDTGRGRRHHRKKRSGSPLIVVAVLLVVVGTGAGFATVGTSGDGSDTAATKAAPDLQPVGATPSAQTGPGGPVRGDFMDITKAPPTEAEPRTGPGASTGSFTTDCGRNENGHHNADNFITAPGVVNGAHHVHDYVGNRSTSGFSTERSLAKAGTTCEKGDKSTYFWPVLRVRGDNDTPDPEGNTGTVLTPARVDLTFRGNAQAKVSAMPRFLRVITGDAKAFSNGPQNAHARWTCTGFDDRRLTERYPLCPTGSQVVRVLDFPSCWDGKNTDSPNHRDHIAFPGRGGGCAEGRTPVPQLRITLAYDVPPGAVFAVDSFPEQLHKPGTDHGDFMNLMPETLMESVVRCVNSGSRCD